jgi:hypothetical protein
VKNKIWQNNGEQANGVSEMKENEDNEWLSIFNGNENNV